MINTIPSIQVASSFVGRSHDAMVIDAARTISVFSKKWMNDEDRAVCLGNNILNPRFEGCGKLYCGDLVAGSRVQGQ